MPALLPVRHTRRQRAIQKARPDLGSPRKRSAAAAASSLITQRRAIRSMVPSARSANGSHRAALGVVGDDLDLILDRALAQTLMAPSGS